MRTITIGGREYPFILSAAAAKKYFIGEFDRSDDDPYSVDASIRLIYNGLKDARIAKSWWYRLWHRLPREKDLARMVEARQIESTIKDLFPAESDSNSQETGKKP